MSTKADIAREYLDKHPGIGARTLACKLTEDHPDQFRSLDAARSVVRRATGASGRQSRERVNDSHFREKRKAGVAYEVDPESAESVTMENDGKKGILSSKSTSIRTVAQLLAYSEVDMNEWEVEKQVVNKWEGFAKLGKKGSESIEKVPLFQIKVWLKRRILEKRITTLMQGLLAEFRRPAVKVPKVKPSNSGVLMELSVFDLHLGKLCWDDEVGFNYDTAIASATFADAVEALMERAAGYKPDRIVIPIGNDFFNVDNAAQTTNAGTPQDEDGRWQRSFVNGRKLMVDAIDRLRAVAPVDVIMVAGNHDTERIFYLGDVLNAWFNKTANVTVNNSPTQRKYYQWGKCLLGFTHGNNEKHAELPLIMANEAPKQWAETRFREFHLGHWHHRREDVFRSATEKQTIRTRVIPSLCPRDAWHTSKGYFGLRAAEAFLWEKGGGCVANLSWSPS